MKARYTKHYHDGRWMLVQRNEGGWEIWMRLANWEDTTPIPMQAGFRTMRDAKEMAEYLAELDGWEPETGWTRELIPDIPREQGEMF